MEKNHLFYQPSSDYLLWMAYQRIVVFGDLFGLWLNMSPDSSNAKSFRKIILDEVDEGSLKQASTQTIVTNQQLVESALTLIRDF